MDMLVIVAHPDDEVLGCGGTIARFAATGADIQIAIICEGATSRSGHAGGDELEALQISARNAAAILGARGVDFFGLPDNMLDTIPLLSVVKIVEQLVAEYRPATIFTHFSGDLNIDHGVVSRAVTTATRPTLGLSVREILAFPVPSSTEWAFAQNGLTFSPNVFMDITGYTETKTRALHAYSQEMRPYPHPRSDQAVQAAATHWGATAGLEQGEAFQLVRSIR